MHIYCQILCIVLNTLQTLKEVWVFLFLQSPQQTSQETHVYLNEFKRSWFVIGGFLLVWFVSVCFKVQLLVIVLFQAVISQFASLKINTSRLIVQSVTNSLTSLTLQTNTKKATNFGLSVFTGRQKIIFMLNLHQNRQSDVFNLQKVTFSIFIQLIW